MSEPLIVVPLDGSELSERAAPYASAMAKATGAPLLVLTVWEPSAPWKRRLFQGPPADALVDRAKAEGIDPVVMASHTRGGLARVVRGSVADRMLQGNAPGAPGPAAMGNARGKTGRKT